MTWQGIFKKRKKRSLVDPDEIFLDSKNIQNFDRQQFEGRLEKPISKRTTIFLSVVFLFIFMVFGVRLINLQVQNGVALRKRSENNILEKINIFNERGIIYDRNKKELAWNEKTKVLGGGVEGKTENEFPRRMYVSNGFAHLLGYVSYPAKDNTGRYWQNDFKGKDGLEKIYNDLLKGENGSKIIETDARGVVHSENIVNTPQKGADIITSIDSRIQRELYSFIRDTSQANGFSGGAGVIMDIENGEILTSTSFPEYDSEILSLGKDVSKINSYINDKRKFFLDRTVSGLYTPGSIVKPFFALGALVENVIDPYKEILSTGSISIPNPYFPDQKTIFKDWRVNGWTNMMEAIAVSSDIYFYAIGGGFEGQKGLGITNIEKYARLFGFGEKTGVDLPDEKFGTIPSPEWKMLNFKGDAWRVGDTYHTSIGQYGFQVTPMEMTRAVSAIANNGKLLTPHFIMGDENKENQFSVIDLPREYFDVIHKGMRMAVTQGTAGSLSVPYVDVAVKTGTAQLGVSKNRVNSWVIGFFPYEKPKYAFTVMMESGPKNGSVNASYVMRLLLDWMAIYTPEYFKTTS